ncbi:unnamed protein product, partial [Ilex paraguariensis]
MNENCITTARANELKFQQKRKSKLFTLALWVDDDALTMCKHCLREGLVVTVVVGEVAAMDRSPPDEYSEMNREEDKQGSNFSITLDF